MAGVFCWYFFSGKAGFGEIEVVEPANPTDLEAYLQIYT